jgi:hypothetical protein
MSLEEFLGNWTRLEMEVDNVDKLPTYTKALILMTALVENEHIQVELCKLESADITKARIMQVARQVMRKLYKYSPSSS